MPRTVIDITGKRFGLLTAVALSGRCNYAKTPMWIMQCNCGGTRELTQGEANYLVKHQKQANCGNRKKHPINYLHYPPTPSPYPTEAGELLAKYIDKARLNYKWVDAEIEDQMRDSLIRLCWIIVYRRSQGEVINENHERKLVYKTVGCAHLKVKRKRNLVYTRKEKQIGIVETKSTLPMYPVNKTLENIYDRTSPKKIKFLKK